jgi:hypothetical protein
LAVAKMKKPRINKISKALKQQHGYLKRNLASIGALIACGGMLLVAVRLSTRSCWSSVGWSASKAFLITQTAEESLIES